MSTRTLSIFPVVQQIFLVERAQRRQLVSASDTCWGALQVYVSERDSSKSILRSEASEGEEHLFLRLSLSGPPSPSLSVKLASQRSKLLTRCDC